MDLPVPTNRMHRPPPILAAEEREARMERSKRRIKKYVEKRKKNNSKRAYYTALSHFWAWCMYAWGVTREEYPVPENIIEDYVINQLDGMPDDVQAALVEMGVVRAPKPKKASEKPKKIKSKLSTIELRLWALNQAHQKHLANIHPRYVYTAKVRDLIKSARTETKHRKKGSKALVKDLLEQLLEALDDAPPHKGAMLRAMISTAFASGGRRVSELINLSPGDVELLECSEFPGWFFALRLGARKTAEAADEVKMVPVRGRAALWLMEWLQLRKELEIHGDPLFRTVRVVRKRVRSGPRKGKMEPVEEILSGITATWFWRQMKALAEKAGIEGNITPHSIRAGYATQAMRDGIVIKDAMALTDHKSEKVFMGYVEARDALYSDAGRLL